MGEFLANLFFTGLMAGSKNLEKILLNRHIKTSYLIFSSILKPPNKPGKINLPKIPPCTARVA